MQTIELDPRDRLLQEHVPAVMVPKFTPFAPLGSVGHRYLVENTGLSLEVWRPWLHLVWPLAASPIPLPYGQVPIGKMEFAFDMNGVEFQCHMRTFEDAARAAMPNECAAWFVWNTESNQLEYWPLISTAATPGSVTFNRPALIDHLHLAVDLQSHGSFAPFFSGQDDADDAGEVKLSIVLGSSPAEDRKIRLCAHGLFIPFEGEE